jgi:hypothetical protein
MALQDGGVVGGLLDGLRLGQADARSTDMYEEEKRRRAKAEGRSDTLFDQQQADYQHTQERRPVEEQQKDQQFQSQMTGADLQQQGQRFALERQPIEAAQSDENHQLGVQGKRENIKGAQQSRGIQAQDAAHRNKRYSFEDDQMEVERALNETKKLIAPAFVQGAQSGDWSALQESWNQSEIGQHSPVDSIQTIPGKGVVVTAGGKPVFQGDVRNFEAFVSNAIDPTSAFEQMAAQRRAISDREAGVPGKGSSQDPAVIRETNEVFRRLKPAEGESDDERWQRAYSQVNEKGHTPVEDVHAKIYQEALKQLQANPLQTRGMTPEQISSAAFDMADSYVAELQNRSAGRSASGLQGQQTAPAQVGAPAAPAAAPAGDHGRVVATAVDTIGKYGPKGGKVVRYEDGTVAPAQ